ncbi:MAG: alpha/beta fold hydrolase [Anaerolineales bacterium]|nr:alpha/beta fold hydrolase [Anaerolineales bacterium]
MQDDYVDVDHAGRTIKTRYWQAGAAGSAVVCVHGLGGYVENWELTIPALAAQHRVYALDLVGFGYTEKPDVDYSLHYLAGFVQAFMHALDLEEASIIGHSLGGAITLQLALLHPESVHKLVLVSSGGFGREVAGLFRVLSLPLLGELLFHPTKKAIARGLKVAFYDERHITPERIERGYKMATLSGLTHTTLNTIRTSTNMRGFKPEAIDPILNHLDKVLMPSLTIWGKQDAAVPVTHAEVAQQRLPDCQSHIFEECGHWPQIEHSMAFNQLVVDFLMD